jgi:hypothetical protein
VLAQKFSILLAGSRAPSRTHGLDLTHADRDLRGPKILDRHRLQSWLARERHVVELVSRQ